MPRTALHATLLTASFALTWGASALAQAAQPLQLKVYNADAGSFNVTSTLVTGAKEAVVIDAGFTRADALRIAANVLDSGKRLTTIYVSQADPDYYFGAETLLQFFPDARVVTTPAVLEKIQAKLPAKLAFWGPKMGANAPQSPVLPQALPSTTLTVDGQPIEIRGTSGLLAHRPYAWIPSLHAIVGNVGVFGAMHVWMADTQTAAEKSAWQAQLAEMTALQPRVVVPGHMKAGSPMDASAIGHTADYLRAFDAQAAAASDGADLIARMNKAYPGAPGALSLDIGAKVAKGEMKW